MAILLHGDSNKDKMRASYDGGRKAFKQSSTVKWNNKNRSQEMHTDKKITKHQKERQGEVKTKKKTQKYFNCSLWFLLYSHLQQDSPFKKMFFNNILTA